ncbi:GNAT family N-acetyltransferase [Pelagibius sp. CAU 1746]|uniref:GNAT family N-acetyltransferase n=1 Tax=Pelagibius sp. CAU 1746 TaxID=3140370 RepID=UPI00325B12F9
MIRFRPLADADLPMLLDWLQRPHVKEWWDDGDDTLEKVCAHYGARDGTRRFIAEREGVAIGYFQYYRNGAGEIGCDQFLAGPESLSHGIGCACLEAFIDLIAAAEAPATILVDPHPDNARAIRCYEKCGFLSDAERSSPALCCMTKVLPES